MSTYRNVTVSLPVSVLRQIKRIAARKQTSISRLLTQALEEMAAQDDGFARARARHLAWLVQAPDLGTGGHSASTRESLHER